MSNKTKMRNFRREHINYEEQEQIAVANYLKSLGKLFTIAPNGMKLPFSVAKKMKAMGYSKGCPDIMVFEEGKIFAYKGLFIELKRSAVYGDSKVSPEQEQWKKDLNERGYQAVICRGAQEAYKAIDDYFGLILTGG